MILERRHPAHDPFMFEGRAIPLDRFFKIRASGMDHFAQMFKNRARKRSRFLDVCVNARILTSHVIVFANNSRFAKSFSKIRTHPSGPLRRALATATRLGPRPTKSWGGMGRRSCT